MDVYPVMDLMGGVVVRGAGGDRASYRPVESPLARPAEPLPVARAFRERFGLDRIYVADIDALEGAPPAYGTFRALHAAGFHLLVDAGVRSADEALALARAGAGDVVAPLETLPGPDALERIVDSLGPERVLFSLDRKGPRLLGDPSIWGAAVAPGADGATRVALEAHRRGARRILLLDLARVGSRAGPAHLGLIKSLAAELPETTLLAGGGVRSAADLEALALAGASGVLVASALHDGTITSADLARIQRPGSAAPRRTAEMAVEPI